MQRHHTEMYESGSAGEGEEQQASPGSAGLQSGACGRGETSRQLPAQDSNDDCWYKVTHTALFQSSGQRVDLRPARRPGAVFRQDNRPGSFVAGICNILL